MVFLTSLGITRSQTIDLALDTTTIAIGDQTRLTVTATREITQNEFDFKWPSWKDSIPGGLEIIRPLQADTIAVDMDNGDVAFAIRRSFLVTAWDSGFLQIPPVGVIFGPDTLFSNAAVLNVLLAPRGKEGEIAAPADIRETQWTLAERIKQWLPWILLSIATAGVLWIAIRKWRNRTPQVKAIASEISKPKEPAHIIALRELEQIGIDADWKKGSVKRHHARTSEALRRYLEGRFDFRALERSTVEIHLGISSLPLLDEDRKILLEVLEMSDLVKFAKWNPTADDHIRVVKRAIRFIEQTLPTTEGSESADVS
jgi:hypothetical protein